MKFSAKKQCLPGEALFHVLILFAVYDVMVDKVTKL